MVASRHDSCCVYCSLQVLRRQRFRRSCNICLMVAVWSTARYSLPSFRLLMACVGFSRMAVRSQIIHDSLLYVHATYIGSCNLISLCMYSSEPMF